MKMIIIILVALIWGIICGVVFPFPFSYVLSLLGGLIIGGSLSIVLQND